MLSCVPLVQYFHALLYGIMPVTDRITVMIVLPVLHCWIINTTAISDASADACKREISDKCVLAYVMVTFN